MEPTIRVKLASEIAEVISSRDVLALLKDRLLKSKSDHIELDFSDVEFISRSAAHELLLLKESISSVKEINFANMNREVEVMLNTVRHHRIAANKSTFVLPKVMDINVLTN